MSEPVLTQTTSRTSRTDKLKIGFAGVGWIGKNRMEAILKEGVAEVAGVCEKDKKLLAETGASYHHAFATDSFEEMLKQDLDAVVIATPSALHSSQSLAALENGLAVFCQKPLARNARQTEEVVEAAKKADRLLGVDFSYRDTKGMRALKNIIDSGEIGKVYAAELVFHNAYGPDKSWYYDPELSGGGCLMDLGIHLIDNLHHIFPGAGLKNAHGTIFQNGKPMKNPASTAEDFVSAQLDFDNDLSAQISCSWNLSAGRDAVISASFYGTEGGVSFQNVNGSFYDFKTLLFKGTHKEEVVLPPDNWSGRSAALWAMNLYRDKTYNTQAADYIKIAQTMDAIYQS